MFSINITERTLESIRTIPPFYSIYLRVFQQYIYKTKCPLDRKEKSINKMASHFTLLTQQMLFLQRKRNCSTNFKLYK